MDEPASALDPLATYKIEELVRELASEVTIVIVTHNMQQASGVSAHTAFMLAGDDVDLRTWEFAVDGLVNEPAKWMWDEFLALPAQDKVLLVDETLLPVLEKFRARIGRLVESGNTEDLFTTPRDPRTEAYITGRFG